MFIASASGLQIWLQECLLFVRSSDNNKGYFKIELMEKRQLEFIIFNHKTCLTEKYCNVGSFVAIQILLRNHCVDILH